MDDLRVLARSNDPDRAVLDPEPIHLLASDNLRGWSLAKSATGFQGLEFRSHGQVHLERPRGHLAKTLLFTVLTEPWPVKFSRNTKINLREQGFCQ
jgi:hypothetical protein